LVFELVLLGIPKLTVIVVEDLVSVVPAVILYTSRADNELPFHALVVVYKTSSHSPNS
jgi:hypothetical protein